MLINCYCLKDLIVDRHTPYQRTYEVWKLYITPVMKSLYEIRVHEPLFAH